MMNWERKTYHVLKALYGAEKPMSSQEVLEKIGLRPGARASVLVTLQILNREGYANMIPGVVGESVSRFQLNYKGVVRAERELAMGEPRSIVEWLTRSRREARRR